MAGVGTSPLVQQNPWTGGMEYGYRGGQQPAIPPGYEWDPIAQKYTRTPTSAGQRVGQFQSGAYNAGPMSGLLAAGRSGGLGGFGGVSGGVGFGSSSPIDGGGGSIGATTGTRTGSTGSDGGFGGHYPQPTDPTKANAATFATAKDQVGQEGRGALNALQGELGAQGNLGGGAAVQGTRDIIQHGAEQLSGITGQQAESNRQATNQANLAGYQGGIQMRGQDIQHEQNIAQNALQQRLAQMGLLQQAMQGLSGAGAQFMY